MEKEYVVISVKNDDLIAHENKSVKAIFTLEITFEVEVGMSYEIKKNAHL
jgi:hypothetical protein